MIECAGKGIKPFITASLPIGYNARLLSTIISYLGSEAVMKGSIPLPAHSIMIPQKVAFVELGPMQ